MFWDLKGIHGNEVVGTWEEIQGSKISICIAGSFVLATDDKNIDSTVLSYWGCHYVVVHRIVGKKLLFLTLAYPSVSHSEFMIRLFCFYSFPLLPQWGTVKGVVGRR